MLNKEDVYQSCAKSQASKSFNSNSRVHKLIQFKTASKIQDIFYIKVEDYLKITAREISKTNQAHLCSFLTQPQPNRRVLKFILSNMSYFKYSQNDNFLNGNLSRAEACVTIQEIRK